MPPERCGVAGRGFLEKSQNRPLGMESNCLRLISSHNNQQGVTMRTTSDPKPNNLKVRLNDNAFSFLKRKSKDNGESVSDYIRTLLEKEMVEEMKANGR